jgi:hypothetical protein
VIRERLPLVTHRGRYLLLLVTLPLLGALWALPVAQWTFFVAALHAVYVVVAGQRRVEIDTEGFRTRTAPWLTFVRDWTGRRADVRRLVRHHRPVIEARHGPATDYYHVAAETHDHHLVFLRGPWREPEPADVALHEVAALWPDVPVGEPTSGEHPTQRRATARAAIGWTFGLIVALLLTALGDEFTRGSLFGG